MQFSEIQVGMVLLFRKDQSHPPIFSYRIERLLTEGAALIARVVEVRPEIEFIALQFDPSIEPGTQILYNSWGGNWVTNEDLIKDYYRVNSL